MRTNFTSDSTATNQIPGLLDAPRGGDFLPYIGKLQERASTGDSAAAVALGHMYFKGGRRISRDYIAARYWWQKVDLEYDVTGFVASHLATIYYEGLGVSVDRIKAYKYLRSAVLHGHRNSMVLLAILNKKGYGASGKAHSANIMLRASLANPKVSMFMRFLAMAWLI